MELEEHTIRLLRRVLHGNLPESDPEFQAWLAASEKNRCLYEELCTLMGRQKEDPIPLTDLDRLWASIAPITHPARKLRSWRRIGWGSAAAALLLGALWVFRPEPNAAPIDSLAQNSDTTQTYVITASGKHLSLETLLKGQTIDGASVQATAGHELSYQSAIHAPVATHTLVVPKGAFQKLTLPDGTQVWLNSDSRLTFPTRFDSQKREVTLAGEAYFDVTKGSGTFVVITDPVSYTVLGTTFNIRAYAEELTASAALITGKLAAETAGKITYMTPNQLAVYDRTAETMTLRNEELAAQPSWISGILLFDHAPLAEILAQIAHWYEFTVVYTNPAFAQHHFTCMIDRKESLSVFLERMNLTDNLKFTIQGNNLTISTKEPE